MKAFILKASVGFVAALGLLTVGCDTDSAETVIRDVLINVQGFYSNGENPVVANNTGASIQTLDIQQNGDQLIAIDNNGRVFRGTIGRDNNDIASITLSGETTAGQQGQIVGTIDVSGSEAVLTGTWVEPSLFSTVAGKAALPNQPDIDPQPGTNTNGIVFFMPDAYRQPPSGPSSYWLLLAGIAAVFYFAAVRRNPDQAAA